MTHYDLMIVLSIYLVSLTISLPYSIYLFVTAADKDEIADSIMNIAFSILPINFLWAFGLLLFSAWRGIERLAEIIDKKRKL